MYNNFKYIYNSCNTKLYEFKNNMILNKINILSKKSEIFSAVDFNSI